MSHRVTKEHSPLIADWSQHREATEALALVLAGLQRLQVLTGADSGVSVTLSMPWDPADPESRPSIALTVAHVAKVVNQCQKVLDRREWSGADPAAVAGLMAMLACQCKECCSRRNWEEHYASREARGLPPSDAPARKVEREQPSEPEETLPERLAKAYLNRPTK